MKGKIIVIEGTDCSGKETQSKLLINKWNEEGLQTSYLGFPNYSSPTGKIIGYPYLGKQYLVNELVLSNYSKIIKKLREKYGSVDKEIVKATLETLTEMLGHGWFIEGAPNVDGKIASLYYAADRAYNVDKIYEEIDKGHNIVLDRYVYSNMAHQGGKIEDEEERKKMYEWLFDIEFNKMELPQSDIRLFLHMPTAYTALLKSNRREALDEHEKDSKHLSSAEQAYLEIANLYDFEIIECIRDKYETPNMDNIKKIDEINNEVYSHVKKRII